MNKKDIVATSIKQAKELGLTTYFTGKPCSKGHISTRQTADWKCTECRREYVRSRYQNDEDYRKKQHAARKLKYDTDPSFRQAHIDKARKWQRDNAERKKEYLSNYYESNKEKARIYGAARHAEKMKDPEFVAKERERSKRKKKENPESSRTHCRNRRANLRDAQGKHTTKDVRIIYESQNGVCVYCDAELNLDYHVDHIIPISRGGSNGPENLQCLCPPCNLSKHNKTHEEFLEHIKKKPQTKSAA